MSLLNKHRRKPEVFVFIQLSPIPSTLGLGLGCHLIPANGKGHLIHPTALAMLMNMPHFLLFDCDANILKAEHRDRHVPDNKTLFKIAGLQSDEAFPADTIRSAKCWAWKTNFGDTVDADFDEKLLTKYKEQAQKTCGHASSLEKNSLYIAEWLTNAFDDGKSSASLQELCLAIIAAASVGSPSESSILVSTQQISGAVTAPAASSVVPAVARSVEKLSAAKKPSGTRADGDATS